MVTRNAYSAKSQPVSILLSVVTADEDMPVGQYNSVYTGAEIDKLLTDTEQIPNKEDKPIVENITGTEVSLDVKAGHEYICGELVSLKIGTVEKSARTSAIFFSSGAVATELTWSDDLVEIVGYKTPAVNKAYEINIEELRAIIE